MSRVQVLDGFTAYGIAVKHGFQGTEEEWLESIPATIGENGNWWVDGKDTGVLADPAKLLSLTQRAENAAIHQPYPDTNTGTWWVWDADAGEYRDSGIRAKADELKIAGPDVLGGVQPVAKDDTMTIPVGVDDAGRLYSGKDPDVDRLKSDVDNLANEYELIDTITLTENSLIYINLPYACKKVMLKGINVVTVSGTYYWCLNGAINKSAYAIAMESPPIKLEEKSEWFAEIELNANVMKCLSGRSLNIYTTSTAKLIMNAVDKEEYTNGITSLTGQNVHMAGSIIKVYGVRK